MNNKNKSKKYKFNLKQHAGYIYQPPPKIDSEYDPVAPQVPAIENGSPYENANNELIATTESQIKMNNLLNGVQEAGSQKNILKSKLKKKKISYNNIKKMGKSYTYKQKKGGNRNYPVDVKSNIPPSKQWTNPDTIAPEPQYNGGVFIGPQAYGPWGTIPVTPTTTEMIHNNLQSANPPPGATVQYPGTDRLGNNFIAMPGIDWYANTTNMNPGPFRIKGTSCPPPNQCGGRKKNKIHKRKFNHKKSTLRKIKKKQSHNSKFKSQKKKKKKKHKKKKKKKKNKKKKKKKKKITKI